MASLVEELQQDALNDRVKVSDLLRKAKAIAHKLNLPELANWVEDELNGYPNDREVPNYRLLSGQIKGHNPFHGWQPVIFSDLKTEKIMSTVPNGQRVAEIEDLIARSKGKSGQLMHSLSGSQKKMLMQSVGQNMDFTIMLDVSGLVGILDAVRNALLDWSLKLETSRDIGRRNVLFDRRA